jgi:hypothetical protein
MLDKESRAMVSEAARGLNGAAADNFMSAAIARLQEALDSGLIKQVTKNNVRAACSAELAKGK